MKTIIRNCQEYSLKNLSNLLYSLAILGSENQTLIKIVRARILSTEPSELIPHLKPIHIAQLLESFSDQLDFDLTYALEYALVE